MNYVKYCPLSLDGERLYHLGQIVKWAYSAENDDFMALVSPIQSPYECEVWGFDKVHRRDLAAISAMEFEKIYNKQCKCLQERKEKSK